MFRQIILERKVGAMQGQPLELKHRRQRRLEVLRDRFVAVSMRSRTLRLAAPSRSGAFDLSRIARLRDRFWLDEVCRVLGQDEDDGHVELVALQPGDEIERNISLDLGVLFDAALTERVESGADTLGVGWPFVKGMAHDGTWFRAPLLIYPVELYKTRTGRLVWRMRPSGAPCINDALVQVMARYFGVKWSLEAILEADSDGCLSPDASTWNDLLDTLRHMRGVEIMAESLDEKTSPARYERWGREVRLAEQTETGHIELCFQAVLGRFPLAATSVILDYHELLESNLDEGALGAALPLVQVDEQAATLSPSSLSHHATAPSPEDTSDANFEHSGWRPFLSDSSQDAVISYIQRHDDGSPGGIVVQGPPGTGKSQLIANLLCEVLAQGKTALVVCQKRAALEVVSARLAVLGLHEALAVVHDVRRDRNLFCQKLAATLTPLLHVDESQRKLDHFRRESARKAHGKAMNVVSRRLAQMQRVWDVLLGAGADRPGLLELEERLADNEDLGKFDHSPGEGARVNLDTFAWQLDESSLPALLHEVDVLAPEARPFAGDHPWRARQTLARYGDDRAGLASLYERLQELERAVATLARSCSVGCLSPEKAMGFEGLWGEVQALLELVEEGNEEALDDFALFWTWCDGDRKKGLWLEMTKRLERARRELRPVPWSLVLCEARQLREWIDGLTELRALEGKWWRFFSPRFWKLKKIPREVLEVVEKTDAFRTDGDESAVPVDLIAMCEGSLAWQALIADLPEDNAFFDFGFQGNPDAIEEELEAVEKHVSLVQEVHRVHEVLRAHGDPYARLPEVWSVLAGGVGSLPFFASLQADAHAGSLSRQCAEILDEMQEVWGSSWVEQGKALCQSGEASRLHACIEALLQSVDLETLARLATLDARLARQEHASLDHFLRAYRGEVQQARAWFEYSVVSAWKSAWLERAGGEARISEVVEGTLYREALMDAIDARRVHAADALLAQYRGGVQAASQQDGGERRKALQQLLTQARKQRYRLTLRQMVDQFWESALRLVRPIWLCSPDSVASLFPLHMGLFDVVIFDEASQCPVESAIGALVRGKQVVIAGDDQQMPPSHFFSASTQDVEEDEVAEESLLASDSLIEAARQSFEQITLRWHYRSRYEELIAFSNRAFYGNRLKTAPGVLQVIEEDEAAMLAQGLRFIDVPHATWEAQSNEKEARAVVEHLRALMSLAEPPSLGVVTFNLKQAELIERTIQEEIQRDAEFLRAYERDRLRPLTQQLFVRNLENVQGDERDVMLMSVGYAPSEPGSKVMARFGPIGHEGGEKRLNVAITRAREAYLVFCSFNPESLDVEGSKHVGPRLFKQFLCYARALSMAQGAGGASGKDALERAARLVGGRGVVAARREVSSHGFGVGERFKEEVYRELVGRGHRVDRDIGMGDLHMDLVVHGTSRVALDITQYLKIPDTMTREVYTPRFWERAGWRVLRVTPYRWSREKEAVLAQIAQLSQGSF